MFFEQRFVEFEKRQLSCYINMVSFSMLFYDWYIYYQLFYFIIMITYAIKYEKILINSKYDLLHW